MSYSLNSYKGGFYRGFDNPLHLGFRVEGPKILKGGGYNGDYKGSIVGVIKGILGV